MITAQQMKDLEDYAESKGISKLELMENAGRQVFCVVKKKYGLMGKCVVVFAGSGNNAGDGFVAARYFAKECQTIVLFFGEEVKLPQEVKKNHKKIKDDIAIIKIKTEKDLEKFRFQEHLDFILVDALLGTGVKGEVREPVSLGIDCFNSLSGIKVAVDLPSGLGTDGLGEKICDCDLIITFHDLKAGLEKFGEKVVVVRIGIPK